MKKRYLTVDKILKTLAKRKTIKGLKVRWVLEKDPISNTSDLIRVRVGSKLFCPITFYCFIKTKKTFSTYQTNKAANKSNVPNDIRGEIDDAADDVGTPTLRKKILKATGLLAQAQKNGEKI